MKKSILIIAAMLLTGCENPEVDSPSTAYTKSYVLMYNTYEEINAVWLENEYITLDYVLNSGYGVLSTSESDKAKYKAKCDKHSDYYEEYKLVTWITLIPNSFQDRDFSSIDIVSDADYDPAHPAGTSLGDLFYFASSSPIKYIQRGYASKWYAPSSFPSYYRFYLDPSTLSDMGLDPLFGLLSEMEAEDLVLLGNPTTYKRYRIANFTPVKKPESAQVHNFTVRLTDTDGQVLSATVRAEFE